MNNNVNYNKYKQQDVDNYVLRSLFKMWKCGKKVNYKGVNIFRISYFFVAYNFYILQNDIVYLQILTQNILSGPKYAKY